MTGFFRKKGLDWRQAYHASQDGSTSIQTWKIKNKNKWESWLKAVGLAALVVLVLLIIAVLFNIAAIKSLYQQVNSGKANLEEAVFQVEQGQFSTAARYAEYAAGNFEQAASVVQGYENNLLVKNIGSLKKEQDSLFRSLRGASVMSSSGKQLALIAHNLGALTGQKNTSFTHLSTEKKREVLEFIYKTNPELAGIQANIKLACEDISSLKQSWLVWPLKGMVDQAAVRLDRFQQGYSHMLALARLAPEAMGYPDQMSYLLVLQNNDELRPTGGFIGTYGILTVKDGEIDRLDTHDIYHMDMPVRDTLSIQPPHPIDQYLVDKWYMRDANWSPDWPQSAEKIEWFYHQENSLLPPKDDINDFDKKFDGIIAITPNVVENLLRIVGPVELEGEVYTADNFQNLLQYRVEKGHIELGIPSWHRKEIIGEILKELKQRVLAAPIEHYASIFKTVIQDLEKKNIMVYFKRGHLAEAARQANWDGAMPAVDGDYLYVVDANLGSLKTDAVMERSISYSIDSRASGAAANLKINYDHTGQADWKTSRYRSYTRIYTPKGSELVSARGFAETLNGSQADVYTENGYTVFAGLVLVSPNGNTKLELEYRLPAKFSTDKIDSYSLYVQKQPGKEVEPLSVKFSFSSPLINYVPQESFDSSPEVGQAAWKTDLSVDREFRALFNRN
jgi:hypothetical protein